MLKYALVKLKTKIQIYRSYIESQNDNNANDGSMASSYSTFEMEKKFYPLAKGPLSYGSRY